LYRRPDGEDWDFAALRMNNGNLSPGNGGVDEGYLVGGVVFVQECPLEGCRQLQPPKDVDNEILGLKLKVRPGAPLGATELKFLDGAKAHPAGPGITNVATLQHVSADVRFDVKPTLITAQLAIVEDISLFLRGDSSWDFKLDLSDAVLTLNYLFLGAGPPRCLDAADANDDGTLDISDPVGTLLFLYHTGSALPPPTGAPGRDPTPDDPLDCSGN
ncbi:MAG: hypothetical protein ACRD2T_15850, partial [Thermoanaerobaculia bacterium]